MRIDAHAHLFPERFLRRIEALGDKYPVQIRRPRPGADRVFYAGGREFYTYTPDFYDVDVRLGQMAESGVDAQVLSLAPPMVYWAEPELARELCQLYNDEVATIVRRHPGKFAALAAVPLQDTEAAIEELKRAVREDGARGVMLPSVIGSEDVDSPRLFSFYEAVCDLGLPIFLHPIPRPGPEGLRLRDYRLDVTVGFVMDTTLAAARLVQSGILPRLPGLEVMLSHLGGTVPFLWGRLSGGFKMFAGEWEWGDPADHFARMYLDAICYRPEPLAYVARLVGAERILYGSDDPFFGAENMRQAAETIERCTELDAAAKRMIFGGNAARLFRLEARAGAPSSSRRPDA